NLAVLLLLSGCAARAVAPPPQLPAAAPQPPVRTVELEPMRIDVVQGPAGAETRAYDARSLLDEGNENLVLHRYDAALAAYEHLLPDYPDSRLVAPALFNAGQALEGKEDWAGAAERYRRLLKEVAAAPETKEDRKNAAFRLAAVLAEGGRYPESIQSLET